MTTAEALGAYFEARNAQRERLVRLRRHVVRELRDIERLGRAAWREFVRAEEDADEDWEELPSDAVAEADFAPLDRDQLREMLEGEPLPRKFRAPLTRAEEFVRGAR